MTKTTAWAVGITGSNGQLTTTTPQCQNDSQAPNFFGTSAATPHAAGIAALMQQSNTGVTPGAPSRTVTPVAAGTDTYTLALGAL